MFKISYDKKITMVQGDTGVIRMRIHNYELSQGDEVRFAIVNKTNPSILLCQHSDKKIVLEKQVTAFEKDGSARIVIYPYDTEYLQPGKYLYEIQVKTKDGRIDTVVPLTGFTLMDGSIQGEFGQTTPSKPEPTPSEIELRFKRIENEIIPELGTRITNVENEIDSVSSSLDDMENWIKNEPVKLTDYASKKNGDDWAPVVNYLIEQGYRNIVIPSGNYKFLTIAYLVDGLKIKGQFGAGFSSTGKTVIEVSTTAFTFSKNTVLSQHQEITIEDIVFKGGTSVIDFALCHIVNLKNVTFIDFTDNGVILTRGERHNFENVNFWSQSKSFNVAFAFADKTLSTHTEIQNMSFGVDGEWIDRLTIKNCTTMNGAETRYNYTLWVGNKLSHSTIHNLYCHGGLVSAMRVKIMQQCDLFNWVMDGWGTSEKPCENLIDIQKQAFDCNFTSISPHFAGNNKCITQFHIGGGQGITVQSCYASGDNITTYGFKLDNKVGQNITFIGCRGAFYTEGANELIKNQINHVGCSYTVSNTGSTIFNPFGLNEIHNLMNDTNGATKSTGVVKYIYSRGGGNMGTMLEFGENIIKLGHSGVYITIGNGNPNNVVAAPLGSLYLNKDGGDQTTLYIKESGGGGNTGWVVK